MTLAEKPQDTGTHSLSKRFNQATALIDQEPKAIRADVEKDYVVAAKVEVAENGLKYKVALGNGLKWRTVLDISVDAEQEEISVTIMGITPPHDTDFDHKEHGVVSMVRYGANGRQDLETTDLSDPDWETNWEKQPEAEVFDSRRKALETLGFIDLGNYRFPARLNMDDFAVSCLSRLQAGERNPGFIQDQLEKSSVKEKAAV